MEITSCANARVKQWVKYHEKKYRDKDQRFLVEGEHLIQEAIAAGLLETLIKTKNCPYEFNFDKEVILASEEVMHKLRMNVSTSTCIGICCYKDSNITLGSKVVLLDDVQDPGNAGTIIRTAHSFGFDSVVLSNRSVDLYNEKLIRSTQGALFHMDVVKSSLGDVITKLKKDGVKVYATALQNARGLSEYHNEKKTALIFGNEGKGVSEEVLAMADDCIFIEMSTFESLNVAIAAGICCYAFRKWRNKMENCCICASLIHQENEHSLSRRIHGCTCDECQQVYESLCNSNMHDIYAFRLAKRYFEKHFSSVENDIHLNLLQLLNEEKKRMQSQIDKRYKSEEKVSGNDDTINQLGIVSVSVSLLADENANGSDLYEELHKLAQNKFSSKLMIQKIAAISDLNISSPMLINGYWCMNISAIAHQGNKK